MRRIGFSYVSTACACYENGEPHWDKPTWQGPFTKTICDGPQLDWVIAGGESGPGARLMHPDWARSIRDQCKAAGVPFFFKQWGEFDHRNIRVGKKEAGSILDGREHKEWPKS